MEDNIKNLMYSKLTNIINKRLWVKVVVQIGSRQSFKMMTVAYTDDKQIAFYFNLVQPADDLKGDGKYRIVAISDIEHFDNNMVPVFYIKTGILPIICPDYRVVV